MIFLAKTMSGAFLHGCLIGFIAGIYVTAMVVWGLLFLSHT